MIWQRFVAFATLTGGSAAVAIILTKSGHGDASHRLLGGVARSDPRFADICRWGIVREPSGDPTNPYVLHERMQTDSVAVLEHGLALATHTWRDFLAQLGWQPQMIDRTVCHQIGKAHRDRALPAFGLNPEHDFVTYTFLGNTGSAAVPISLGLAAERGFIRPGDRLGLLGIGSGLNCVMLGVQW